MLKEATASKTNPATKTELFPEKLAYLDGNTKQQLTHMLTEMADTAENLRELRPAEAPFEQRFGLVSNTPVHEKIWRLPPYQNGILKNELNKMLVSKRYISKLLTLRFF